MLAITILKYYLEITLNIYELDILEICKMRK